VSIDMGKRGVLWDMDGVLVDTGEFHFQAWSQTLAEYDIPFSRDLFRATFGMNNMGLIAHLLGRKPDPGFIARVSDHKERRFRQAIRGHAQPLPGVLVWLDRLRAMGVRQAVASSAPPENIDTLVDELGIRPYFEAIVSGYDIPGKPDPAVFLKAASELGLPPQRCIVVEDAVAGVQAAKRAGMRCIAVTTTNPAHALSGADIVVERLETLPANVFERLSNGGESAPQV
jgi:beta-phosphoglucomutase family hydrolase